MKTFKDNSFVWPQLEVSIQKILDNHKEMVNPGNQYGLGSKISPDVDPEEADTMPVDCSGYVRYLLIRSATVGGFTFPDGSVVQQDAVRAKGFKISSVASAMAKDGVLRIAFFKPGKGRVGHVALVLNGRTIESHGGTGPNSREWTGEGWQGACSVYVLRLPEI